MLTPAQQAAINSTRHTAVIANAGSGKTRVLVEKYIGILLNELTVHPRDVVAITFSEASARDLREKITLRIDEMLHDDATPEEQLIRLQTVRDEIQLAAISTIHSFCGKLLRSYPAEAGVDAAFGILRSPEDEILRDETINDILYRSLVSAYDEKTVDDNAILPLLHTLGRAETARTLGALLRSRYRADLLTSRLHSLSADELQHKWELRVEEGLSHILEMFDLESYSKAFASLSKPSATLKKGVDALELYKKSTDTREKLLALGEIFTTVHKSEWNDIRKEFSDKSDESLIPALQKNVFVITPYWKFAESYINDSPDSSARYAALIRSIIALYIDVRYSYDERKIAYSLLDFDDLLLKALKLLSNSEVARELRSTYRHILVDEYQDTDDIQFEIIRALTNDFTSGQLVVVGDPKQSIYRFRNANIALFNKTVSSLTTADSEPVILQESFRMLAAPMAFINTLFGNIFAATHTTGAAIDYTPLILGRADIELGSVTVLRSYDTDGTPTEAELVALKIAEFVRGKPEHTLRNELGEQVRPSFGDIAILLRSRGKQSQIEEALRKNDIPFLVHRGSGFYSEQEIIDCLSYLRFLLSPSDDISLMGILRSPFFAINDDIIVRMGLQFPKLTLWGKLRSYVSTTDVPDFLRETYRQLEQNVRIAGRMAPSKLLRKIFSETGVYATYQALQGGDQMIANIEKFAWIISNMESASFTGLFDLIERLNIFADKSDQEALADISSDNDAVNILTIHGSKGLEFPIVFLPYLQKNLLKSDPRTAEIPINSQIGIALSKPNDPPPPIVELMKLTTIFDSLEEEKRILYVAMTRAREHLFLSLTLQEAKEGKEEKTVVKNSYAGWIADAFGIDFSKDISFTSELLRYDGTTGNQRSQEIAITVPILTSVEAVEMRREDTAGEEETITARIEKLSPSESHVRYSPSQLLTYVECPTKYYLRYGLGIPEDPRISFSFEPADQAEFIKGTLIGQLVHGVFEKIDEIVTDGVMDEKKYTETLSIALERLAINPEHDLARYSSRVLKHIRAFLAHKEAKTILSSLSHSTEVPLRSLLSDGKMLSGIIDRVYVGSDGAWTILDYKTDRIINSEGKDMRYEFQMKLYAYLIHSQHPEQKSVTTRLFYTNYSVFKDHTFTERGLNTVGKELDLLVAKIRTDKITPSLALIERNRTHCPECAYYDAGRDRCLADH